LEFLGFKRAERLGYLKVEKQDVSLANQCLRELFKLECATVKNELVEIAEEFEKLNQLVE
jgi:hypothetical protein